MLSVLRAYLAKRVEKRRHLAEIAEKRRWLEEHWPADVLADLRRPLERPIPLRHRLFEVAGALVGLVAFQVLPAIGAMALVPHWSPRARVNLGLAVFIAVPLLVLYLV